jgi:YgiT-type zinc finger domain-containing protein
MKCIICHGEDMQVTAVQEEPKIGPDIVHVPIQIPVCRTCGERYYNRRALHFLEEVDQKLKTGNARLPEVGKILMYS